MADNDDQNLFGGSVDRSRLEEMKAAAGDDPERQRQVEEVQAQVDAVAESDAAAEQARQDALGEQSGQQETEVTTTEVASETASESRASLALSKDELVDRAVTAGLGDREELEQHTKQQLVDDLRASEG
jgi:hypothetical protein